MDILGIKYVAGAIIGDGDRNEVPFTIARAKYVLSTFRAIFSTNRAILTEQKTRITRKFAFGFGQTRRSTEFSNACIVEKHTKNDL